MIFEVKCRQLTEILYRQSNKAKDERLQKSKEHFYSIVQALAGFVVSYVMTLLLRDVVTVYLS